MCADGILRPTDKMSSQKRLRKNLESHEKNIYYCVIRRIEGTIENTPNIGTFSLLGPKERPWLHIQEEGLVFHESVMVLDG